MSRMNIQLNRKNFREQEKNHKAVLIIGKLKTLREKSRRESPSSSIADVSSKVSIPDLSIGFEESANGCVGVSGICCQSGVAGLLKDD